MEPMIYWGSIIRSLRVSNNLTQKEVAAILHVTRQAYSCYETGRTRPTPEAIAILSNVYNVDIYSLVGSCLAPAYVAEQNQFKANLPSSAEAIDKKKKASRVTKANVRAIAFDPGIEPPNKK